MDRGLTLFAYKKKCKLIETSFQKFLLQIPSVSSQDLLNSFSNILLENRIFKVQIPAHSFPSSDWPILNFVNPRDRRAITRLEIVPR